MLYVDIHLPDSMPQYMSHPFGRDHLLQYFFYSSFGLVCLSTITTQSLSFS